MRAGLPSLWCIAVWAVVLSGAAGAPGALGGERVSGNLILFNDNGAWCWFQDERVLVDRAAGRIILASVGDDAGVDGEQRVGDVEVVGFDLATGGRTRFTLHDRLISYGNGDDHNTPALWVRPDGRYLAMYAGHNNDNLSRCRITTDPHDAGRWRPEQRFDWEANNPGGVDFQTSYSNVLYLADEQRLYNFARGDNRSPNIMYSDDHGQSWRYGGKLTYTAEGVGYVNGYPKYASNGADVIHFIMTEHHPRDFNNSIYHGYIRGGRSHRSDGEVMDENIFDEQAPAPNAFTPVFKADSEFGGVRMTRAWSTDLHLDAEGHPHAIFTARADDSTEDHRFFYARYDGAEWRVHEMAKAGPGLYRRERDYLGLAALDPDALDTVYISTPIDPRDDAPMEHHEIFRGRTDDGGATWQWTPITEGSDADNLRPVVPAWSESDTAVLWYRGRYTWQHEYDTAIVGVIERSGESVAPARYVDAGPHNTLLADGSALATAGPASGKGPADGRWHERRGVGNDSSVLASGEDGAEDAPTLRTTVTVDEDGTYDIWALFWGKASEDWRLRAGFAADDLLRFRQIAAERVEPGDLAAPIITEGDGPVRLYRAYIGRLSLSGGESFTVFIDDDATADDGARRTWYDGIAYGRVTMSD